MPRWPANHASPLLMKQPPTFPVLVQNRSASRFSAIPGGNAEGDVRHAHVVAQHVHQNRRNQVPCTREREQQGSHGRTGHCMKQEQRKEALAACLRCSDRHRGGRAAALEERASRRKLCVPTTAEVAVDLTRAGCARGAALPISTWLQCDAPMTICDTARDRNATKRRECALGSAPSTNEYPQRGAASKLRNNSGKHSPKKINVIPVCPAAKRRRS